MVTSASDPHSTITVEQQDSSTCDPSAMRCNDPFSLNSAPSCSHVEDCNAYCKKIMNDAPQTITSCVGNYDPSYPNEPVVNSFCTCTNGTVAADIVTGVLVGIEEALCFVVNEALPMSADVLKVIGKLSGAKEVEWAGKIVDVGGMLLAHGNKMGKCENVGCPGHEFTVLDPEKLEESLGALNVC